MVVLTDTITRTGWLGARDLARLRRRLRAWWDGEVWAPDGPDDGTRRAEPAPPPTGAAAAAQPPYWTPERIEAAQRVWGAEHLLPGGEAYVQYLLKPLALDPSLTVAEIGCGLGGAVRLMHKGFGVWPKGYEPCPELREAAVALSAKAGLSKKVAIAPIDLLRPELKANAFDRLVARDLVHLLGDKRSFLKSLRDALKKRGQLLITDFVLRDGEAAPDAVTRWAALEPAPSRPWSVGAMAACLQELDLTVHIFADETDSLREMILDGWMLLQNSLRAALPPRPLAAAMLDEGERWARCMAALDSGALRHYRVIVSR